LISSLCVSHEAVSGASSGPKAAQPGPALMDGESVREREMSGDELVRRLQLKSIKAATPEPPASQQHAGNMSGGRHLVPKPTITVCII
ncbi:hypothetical protein NQZ68_027884, partial [Dissostichus eleginoides]